MLESLNTTAGSNGSNGSKPKLSAWIADGYTKTGYVAPVEGLHSGIKFEFRPARDKIRCDYRRRLFRDGAEENEFLTSIIVRHVVSWEGRTSVDEQGADTLHPDIRRKMLEQILGYEGPEKEAKDN